LTLRRKAFADQSVPVDDLFLAGALAALLKQFDGILAFHF
jgi:hypothetical protein